MVYDDQTRIIIWLTFAVDLSILVTHSGRVKFLTTYRTVEASLVPRLQIQHRFTLTSC